MRLRIATTAPVCRSVGRLEVQFGTTHGAPADLRPVVFLALWTLAPLVALAGVRLRAGGRALGLVLAAAGLVVELSSVISMGGGFMYALLCGPLLLVALVASIGATSS